MLNIGPEERKELSGRSFWKLKRGVDIAGALLLMVLLSPLILTVAVLVLFDIGMPLVFWQQRPGLAGRPFKVYKFRTMGPSFDRFGNPVHEQARLSAVGRFLRRTRFDELPQLVNILVGQMSFVGPRPLLPADQSVGSEARLLVRPGLTGWAQVKGGRHLSPLDKAALDIWYVRNASLAVDFDVILRTIIMVFVGDRPDGEATRRAWDDIGRAQSSRADPFLGESVMTPDPPVNQQVA